MLLECNIVCLIRFLPTCRYLLDTWGLAALQYMLQVNLNLPAGMRAAVAASGGWWRARGRGRGWRSGGCRVQRTSGVIVVMTPQSCYHLVTATICHLASTRDIVTFDDEDVFDISFSLSRYYCMLIRSGNYN